MKIKCGFLGPFSPPISGPGVKNGMMSSWLKKTSSLELIILNTNVLRNGSFKSKLLFLYRFLIRRKLILSVSKNGRFIFIPLAFLLRKKVVLFPAGGSFDEEINSLALWKKKIFLQTCKSVHQTYVQTHELKDALVNMGFRNVYYFPNPRKYRQKMAQVKLDDQTFKIVFLSKIRKGKGPLLLINSLEALKRKYPNFNITLDFYGLIDPGFKEEFEETIKASSTIQYKGVAEEEKVQEIISQYNLFVLPTMFPEGIPGAVVEAIFTQIPIIISDFTAAKDLITHGEDGIIIPQNNVSKLTVAIEELLTDENKRQLFSKNLERKINHFNIDTNMFFLVENLKML